MNAAAFNVLDALFPKGQRSRRLISLTFRLALHPREWPREAGLALAALASLAAQPFLLLASAYRWLATLRPARARQKRA